MRRTKLSYRVHFLRAIDLNFSICCPSCVFSLFTFISVRSNYIYLINLHSWKLGGIFSMVNIDLESISFVYLGYDIEVNAESSVPVLVKGAF